METRAGGLSGREGGVGLGASAPDPGWGGGAGPAGPGLRGADGRARSSGLLSAGTSRFPSSPAPSSCLPGPQPPAPAFSDRFPLSTPPLTSSSPYLSLVPPAPSPFPSLGHSRVLPWTQLPVTHGLPSQFTPSHSSHPPHFSKTDQTAEVTQF